MHRSIGIFDSGFGGLTVMRAICAELPYENITYFGDTAHLPYGNKSQKTILRYCLDNSAFLMKQNVKLIVVACHSASSIGLDEIRKNIPIPVIGITEEGIEAISSFADESKIGILGTRATITSGIYQKHLPSHQLCPLTCPLFVPLVEEGYAEHALTRMVVNEHLAPLKNKQLDAVLLGCTHYPLLFTHIQEAVGENVRVIDPAYNCAKSCKKLLEDLSLINTQTTSATHRFFVSDDPEKFRLMAETFLKQPISDVLLKEQELHESQCL